MILTAHVIIAVMTVASSVGSFALADKRLIRLTPYFLVVTLATGVGLIFMLPGASMVHLCASGLALSIVTIVFHKAAVRRLAVV